MKSPGLKAFVLAVATLSAVALASLPPTGIAEQPGLFLVLAMLTAVAGSRPVRMASLGIEMTPTHPFILVGLVTLGPMAAALMSVAGVIGAALGRPGWPATIRFAFNLGAVILSTASASSVFFLVGGGVDRAIIGIVIPLAAATSVYFLANTGLVTAAIALERRQRFFSVWRRTFLWTPVSYLAGYAVAVVLLAGGESVLILSLIVGLPTCWILFVFYRQYATGVSGRRVVNLPR